MANMRSAGKNGGQVLLLALVFFGIFSTVAIALFGSLTAYAHSERLRTARAQALALAEAGVDKAVYELDQNASYTGETDTALSTGTFSVSITPIDSSTNAVAVTGYVPNAANPIAKETVHAKLSVNTSIIAFRYGVQVGAGGATMKNGSAINGNLFSDGPVSGSGTIMGDAIVASSSPPISLSGIHVKGNAYAHTLSLCTIDGDAFYASTNTCTVVGSSHPNTPDTPSVPLPVSDAQIRDWEKAATAGGVIAGGYSLINGSSVTLGPKEIDGDFVVSNGSTITLTGPLWVRGNINLSNNAILTVSSSFGDSGTVVIADVPGSEATEGTIYVANGVGVSGDGNGRSALMLLSTNSGTTALSINNNGGTVILYAANGTIDIANNAVAEQATGYAFSLHNNATIDYKAGLQSQSFSNGPGGAWAFSPGSYAVTP